MKIKNFRDLAVTKEREAALLIAEAGLQAIDTEQAMLRSVRREGDVLFIQGKYIPLANVDRVVLVGAGKCALDAASALQRILGERLTRGVVLSLGSADLGRVKTLSGTHPYPTPANVEATKEIIDTLAGLSERDLVIMVISGGGSTLLCQPEKLTCENEADILKTLFKKGATIEEINVLRKHLSYARGGFLAQYAYPAQVIALIFSDVPGNDIGVVASGPTVRDATTVEDARKILEAFDLERTLGVHIPLIETPKDERYFARVWNTILVSNEHALRAMAEKARELGFAPQVKTTTLVGEARTVAASIMEELHAAPSRTALLYGGETTVIVTKPGKGGRGLEAVLAACSALETGELFMSVASDGRDNTDFAGALCDIMTKEKARERGLNVSEYLDNNASYRFFELVGDEILTGDTGSNVSDLIIAIKL